MTRLSIVIPNYNHARFLGESLGSVRAQRRPPDEVIVIDDASEDDSLAVIESESAGLPGFRLVRHDERRGVIVAMNAGDPAWGEREEEAFTVMRAIAETVSPLAEEETMDDAQPAPDVEAEPQGAQR